MASAKNKVIDGEFKGKYILYDGSGVHVDLRESNFGKIKALYLNSNTVSSYQVVDQNSDVSMTSALARSVVGQAVAGNAGGIAGAMTAKVKGVNIVLVTFKNGKKSLMEIDDTRFERLKEKCNYNINLNDNEDNSTFDLYKEFECPHCKSVVYAYADEKCAICKRPYSMPKKEWRKIDIITIPILIFLYPVGLIMMWVNKSYYLRTRVTITILCAIVTIIGIYINANADEYSTSDNFNNKTTIEEIV